jgi:hypothetical protein
MPTMYVVAGPAGSGKTSAFPGDSFGCDYFNADHYAAMLNGGSYIGIPKSIREHWADLREIHSGSHRGGQGLRDRDNPAQHRSFSIR